MGIAGTLEPMLRHGIGVPLPMQVLNIIRMQKEMASVCLRVMSGYGYSNIKKNTSCAPMLRRVKQIWDHINFEK